MAIQSLAMKAYASALSANPGEQKSGQMKTLKTDNTQENFAETIADTIKGVNDIQAEKSEAIEAFVSGENQNVHELMITLQKAGITMSMTSAVRGKVMEAYKELMHMQF